MNDEIIKKVIKAFGVSESEIYTLAAMDAINKTSVDLAKMMGFIFRNQVFSEESRNRLLAAMRVYLQEVNIILEAEQAIEELRRED